MRAVSSIFLQILLTAENVVFVLWYLQRFLDGIGESVACKSEVLEPHGKGAIN